MFKLEVSSFGNFKKYEFSHSDSQTQFSLIPEYGAIIFQVKMKGQELLDSFENPEELSTNIWYKNALLLPFPNRLKHGKYSWNGKDYQFPVNNPDPPINALHGFGSDYPTSVEKTELGKDSASIVCKMNYEGEFDYYPFPFVAFIEYKINTSGDFKVSIKMENTSNEKLPFGTGWHPYFKLSGSLEDWHLSMPIGKKVKVDDKMIPTGLSEEMKVDNYLKDKELDTAYVFRLRGYVVETILKNNDSKLSFWQQHGPSLFHYVQAFIPPKRNSIAIEPMTCNIDAFNNKQGLISLDPGEIWEGKFGFKFEKN